jgi:hypothetical protein
MAVPYPLTALQMLDTPDVRRRPYQQDDVHCEIDRCVLGVIGKFGNVAMPHLMSRPGGTKNILGL